MPRRRLTREESRERTRARIIDAAARVIARRGFHAATVDDIAEEAGFTKGAVYSNFDSKDDLFLTVLEQHMRDRLEEVRETLGTIDSIDRVRGTGQLLGTLVEQDRELWLLFIEFWTYAVRDAEVRNRYARLYDAWRHEIGGIIAAQFAALDIPMPAPPTVLASAAVALNEGFALQQLLAPGDIDAADHGRMYAWLFLGAAAAGHGLAESGALDALRALAGERRGSP